MFCTNCGIKLNSEVKFCSNCGQKTKEEATHLSDKPEAPRIEISPMPSNLPAAKVQISSVEAEGPDEDKIFRVTVKYSVTNDSDDDWGFYETYIQIFNAAGQIIDEIRDSNEISVSKNETIELESYFWGIHSELFGCDPEKAIILLNFTASNVEQHKMKQIPLKAQQHKAIPLSPVKIKDISCITNGNITISDPDDDRECRIEIKALSQNLTERHIPKVQIFGEIIDAKGDAITDIDISSQIMPGAIINLNGGAYVKERKLTDSIADLNVRTYLASANMIYQTSGMTVIQPIIDEESTESEDTQDFEDRFNLIPATKSFEDRLSCDPNIISIIKTNKFDLSVESQVSDNNTYAFLVNINTADNKLHLQQSDGKQIAFILGKYLFEFKDNQVHKSLHDEFDDNVNLQLYVMYNGELIYNIADEKKNANKQCQNENSAPITANNPTTNFSKMITLEFQIKRGEVDMDSIDDDVKETVKKCLNLCKAKKHEEAVRLLLPVMNFEWIWGNCDGDPADLFETVNEIAFDLNSDNSIVKVGESDGSLVITATVNFNLYVKDGVTEDQIIEWLSDNSAYACGYIGSGWTYSGSDGDNVWLVNY